MSSGFHSKEVFGTGPLSSPIWIIGEGPGQQEEADGIPFVGTAGQELDVLLGAAGIERRDCYLDNITTRRPFGNKNEAFFGRSAKTFEATGQPAPEYIQGMRRIHDLLRKHRPNVVVAVGNYSMWGLTMKEQITKWAGSILSSCFIKEYQQKIIPILHPSWIMRGNFVWRTPTIWDLKKAKQESKTPDLNLPTYDWEIAKRDGSFTLEDARKEILASKKFIVDIETFGGRNLACVGYGLSERRAIVVPHTGPVTLEFYRETLENPIPKTGQNLMFDYSFMACVHNIRIWNVVRDNMLAAHAMYPDLPLGHDFLCRVYTRQPYYKDDGKVWRRTGDINQFWKYNAWDDCTEFEVWNGQEVELDSFQARSTTNFTTALIEPYAEATYIAMNVDVERLKALRKSSQETADTLEAGMSKLLGREVNLGSHVQVKQIMYEDLGLPKRYKRVRGSPKSVLSSEKKVMLDLAAKTGSKELLIMVKGKQAKKMVSSYANEKILDIDNRLRCAFKIGGTRGSRLSSSETLWNSGTNQQNFPDLARSFIVPDPGYVFLVLDLMQAESVCVAFDAEDELEIEWFRQGLDSHRMLAAMIYNKEPADIADGERFIAKTSHHALNYMMGHLTFMLTVNQYFESTGVWVDASEAKTLRQQYHALRPRLLMWWQYLFNTVKDQKKLVTYVRSEFQPDGRTRYFIGKWTEDLKSSVVYYKPQTSVGDACHHGTLRFWQDEEMQDLRKYKQVQLLSQLHDGLTFQVKKDMVEQVAPRLMEMMLVDMEARGRKFRIPVEAQVGEAWNKKALSTFGVLR